MPKKSDEMRDNVASPESLTGNQSSQRVRSVGLSNIAAARALFERLPEGNQARINSILNEAAIFLPLAKMGKYNVKHDEYAAGTTKKNMNYHEISTWNSAHFRKLAEPYQSVLENIAKESPSIPEGHRNVIGRYGENSIPFNDTILGKLDPQKEVNVSEFEGFENQEAAEASVGALIEAIDALPPVGKYNIVFRGLLARGNEKESPRYLPEEAGIGTVPIGSIVENRTFMSTSASPGVAAEFMLRQRDNPLYAEQESGGEFERYDAFNSRRIVVEYRHRSGRNVVSLVPEKQAEILFNPNTSFELSSVNRSDIGYVVKAIELDRERLKRMRELENKPTYDVQWGNGPISPDKLNVKSMFSRK